jgi:hypothetical protein
MIIVCMIAYSQADLPLYYYYGRRRGSSRNAEQYVPPEVVHPQLARKPSILPNPRASVVSQILYWKIPSRRAPEGRRNLCATVCGRSQPPLYKGLVRRNRRAKADRNLARPGTVLLLVRGMAFHPLSRAAQSAGMDGRHIFRACGPHRSPIGGHE